MAKELEQMRERGRPVGLVAAIGVVVLILVTVETMVPDMIVGSMIVVAPESGELDEEVAEATSELTAEATEDTAPTGLEAADAADDDAPGA